jgi:PHP family Zn ribbon phosphoesterase
VSAEESLRQAEELMERLEETRKRLEETTDPEVVIEMLSELREIAKEIEAALSRAKREADAGG